ncbi:MAG TPA: hypothetical protein VHG71_06475 [Verrucomicrobiae bacterium]|nr:hypothetical protein [Verrucomicrobiae bacterium]
MKLSVPSFVIVAGLFAAGCAQNKSLFETTPQVSTPPAAKTSSASSATYSTPQIVTPDNSLAGNVVSYNSVGRFVVLSFPVGQLPKIGQPLFLYRAGLKVATLKITGPQHDNDIVADVVSGEAQVGDEVRDQ